MYTQEYKDSFLKKARAFAAASTFMEGLISVGVEKKKAGQAGKSEGSERLYNHIPLSFCLFSADDFEKAEKVLMEFAQSFGNCYIRRTREEEWHLKFDIFYQNSLNVTMHLEVTEYMRIKSERYYVMLDKTGRVSKNAGILNKPAGSGEHPETPDPFDFFFWLRKCEQGLLYGEYISADIGLFRARIKLLELYMISSGLNMKTNYPKYDYLSEKTLEGLKSTYPSVLTGAEIERAAGAALSLYENETEKRGIPLDPGLYYLLFEEKSGKNHIPGGDG